MKIRLALLMVLALSPATAFSQALVDRVPADAFVYVGWKGTDALGPVYEKSKLKKFIDGSSIPEVLHTTLPQLIAKASEDEPGKADDVKQLSHVVELIAKHPAAIFVGKFEAGTGSDPTMHAGLICQAGADKETLLAFFYTMAANDKDSENPVRVFSDGDVLAIAFGYSEKDSPLSAKGPDALGGSAAYAAAKAHLAAESAVVAYVDVEGGLANLDAAVQANDEQGQVAAAWKRGRDASGITGLKRFVYSAGFVGEEWESQSFIDAPAPRTGLLKLLEPMPIDPALLARIPGDATNASVGQFDFALLISTIRDITTAVDPQAGKVVQQALGVLSMSIGRQIERDLLAPLGTQWAIFASPSTGGEGPLGLVIANKLDDPKLAKAAWGDLAFALSNTLPNMMKRQGVTVTPKIDDNAVPGAIVYSFAIDTRPQTPCWVVTDQYMFFGFDPAVIAKAATVGEQAKIETNGKFSAIMKTLGSPAYTSFSFGDLPATAPQATQGVEALWSQAKQVVAIQGITLPDSLLPTAEQVAPLLGSSASASWADAKGFYSKSHSPFPGSGAYGYANGDQMTTAVGVSALSISVLLPSLNRARETANRVKSAANLKQIGSGAILYANENKGAAPPDLGKLITDEGLTAREFICPSGDTSLPMTISTGTPEQQAAWVNAHSDYVYVKPAGPLSAVASDVPLAYEKLGLHGKDGINILYGDGHVDFLRTEGAIADIKKATGAEPVKYVKPKLPTTERATEGVH